MEAQVHSKRRAVGAAYAVLPAFGWAVTCKYLICSVLYVLTVENDIKTLNFSYF